MKNIIKQYVAEIIEAEDNSRAWRKRAAEIKADCKALGRLIAKKEPDFDIDAFMTECREAILAEAMTADPDTAELTATDSPAE